MIRFVSLKRNEIWLKMNVRRYTMCVYMSVHHRMLGNHMYNKEERKRQRERLCKFSLFVVP